MFKKSLLLLTMIAGVLALSSCSEDVRITKNLYDDWWPVHASGSLENEYYKATWDGDLDKYGGIIIKVVHKTNPALSYEMTQYYPALIFKKKPDTFCYAYIQNPREIETSKQLKFYVEDGLIYMETMTDTGRGSGKYAEGRPISIKDKDFLKIDNVTYQRYSAYRAEHPSTTTELAPGDRIPVMIYN